MLPGTPVEEEYAYTRRDQRPEPGGGNGRTATFVLLAIAILVVAGLAAYTFSRLTSGAPQTPARIAVPSVVDQPVADATRALQAKGFTNIVTTNANNDAEKGTVFAQDPAANTSILPTDKITLSVSAGPDSVTIPTGLKGKSLDDVRKALEDAGLKVGSTTQEDAPKLEQNQVVRTDPAEGTSVTKGSTVNLVLATGNVEVPNVRNKAVAVAIGILREAGLEVDPELDYRDAPADAEPNVVIRTDPAIGNKVPVGTTVKITVTKPVDEPSPTVTPTPSDSPSPSESESPTP
jgi:serine/threonine-protein kinase